MKTLKDLKKDGIKIEAGCSNCRTSKIEYLIPLSKFETLLNDKIIEQWKLCKKHCSSWKDKSCDGCDTTVFFYTIRKILGITEEELQQILGCDE